MDYDSVDKTFEGEHQWAFIKGAMQKKPKRFRLKSIALDIDFSTKQMM